MNKNKVTNLSNDLVFHTYYKMEARQKKIVYYLISQLDTKNQEEFKPQVVSFKDLLDILGMGRSGKSYKELNNIILDLMTKYLVYDSGIESKGHHFKNAISWFTDISFIEDEKEHLLAKFTFHAKMKPLLLHLKKFVQIPHHELMKFKSGYAIDLYIYFKAARDKTKKISSFSIVIFDLDELKKQLGLKVHQYKKYNDFKRNVILKGINEINQKSKLLSVKFEEVKEKRGRARKVIQIRFFIYDKEPKNQEKTISLKIKNSPKIKNLTFAKYKAYETLILYSVYETKAFEIVQNIQGEMLIGFEDLFIEQAIKHFETKGKNRKNQSTKAATFVTWFFKGAFEIGTPEWSIFAEKIIQIKKKMEKEAPEKYDNRLLAINMTHEEFRKKAKK